MRLCKIFYLLLCNVVQHGVTRLFGLAFRSGPFGLAVSGSTFQFRPFRSRDPTFLYINNLLPLFIEMIIHKQVITFFIEVIMQCNTNISSSYIQFNTNTSSSYRQAKCHARCCYTNSLLRSHDCD